MARTPTELLRLHRLSEMAREAQEAARPVRQQDLLPPTPVIMRNVHRQIARTITQLEATQAFMQNRNVAQPVEPGRNLDIKG